MSLIRLLPSKGLTLLFCLLIALILLPSTSARAADGQTSDNDNASASAEEDKAKKCGPIFIRDKDGKIHMMENSKEGRCYKHPAAQGEKGFCIKGPTSYACNTEGMMGCDITKANGGVCTTINTGGGVCQCACQ